MAGAFDIVFWPCVMDPKVRDVERLPEKSIDVCLFNGGIRTSEQEYMARLLRAKSKVLVAFGSCAHEGCIPGLANLHDRQEIFDTVYHDSPSLDNPEGLEPRTETRVDEGTLHLPVFYDTLKTLGQTVDVDYILPGCPPEPERIWDALVAIMEGKLPAPGSVIGAGDDRLWRVSAHAQRKEDQELQAHLGDHPRPGHLPAGAGPRLLRHRDARRLRRAVPAGQLAVHRLLRTERRRRRTSARA